MRLRTSTPAVLTLALAACGGGSPTPAPMVDRAANCPTLGLDLEAIERGFEAKRTPPPIPDLGGTLTVYSGRSEKLVGPLIRRFEKLAGVQTSVRYGDTAELAATILEEGARSPADVFFAQDAGALGALQEKGRFEALDPALLDRVPARFRSAEGKWVGTSARVRVIAYNCARTRKEDVPGSVFALTDVKWKGRVGWAPTNGSFQVFVTAMRKLRGNDAAEKWLRDMKANGAKVYPSNDSIAEAVAQGEVELGLLNHYYPFEIREEIEGATVEARFLGGGDPGGFVNVAGVGTLASSKNKRQASAFIDYLLSTDGQGYFVAHTFEYPLIAELEPISALPRLDALEAPAIDLSDLGDLEGTLEMLEEVGLV